MELIEKCEEKLEKKSNLIIFSFGGIFCEFLAHLGVGQGLINMFSDVLQENIFDIHLSRTIDQDQDE